ncbi:Uncharacterized protein HZ326_12064 [Fusarium oxysporum f. sp. albedinis]|nr:Uncharacterized protein HZ326_12064 [Fusarium oxysporum f. sp. albedinis]
MQKKTRRYLTALWVSAVRTILGLASTGINRSCRAEAETVSIYVTELVSPPSQSCYRLFNLVKCHKIYFY